MTPLLAYRPSQPARLVGKDIAELRAEIRAVTDELCAEVVKALELEAEVGRSSP